MELQLFAAETSDKQFTVFSRYENQARTPGSPFLEELAARWVPDVYDEVGSGALDFGKDRRPKAGKLKDDRETDSHSCLRSVWRARSYPVARAAKLLEINFE